ncbi:hypothetical protein B0A50_06151 [Salinomyces thailandicus]|uniref:SGNH hydrolase-type esterase domain-containing protein n=1 Tax=Salinomyces thailandicus TaxID=706561 RepID=A0A4U0TT12_9PEZI|nr:hypothetical protein B0A50_06151 [Salinomyces thailandica]
MEHQFVHFGDSLTEQSFSQTRGFAFGAALSALYARRLDVLNRGLSGYNSTQALQALPLCIPPPSHSQVRLLTIWLGANDARIPGSPGGPDQSVPIETFKSNIRGIVRHPCVQAHRGVKVVLITTPPVDERKCLKADQEKYPALAGVLRRSAAHTAAYAQAVRDVGVELEVPVVDIWSALVARAGYAGPVEGEAVAGALGLPTCEGLQGFLHDGLHFDGEGYRVLFGEVMGLVGRLWPELMPSRLPMRLPAWDDAGAWQEGGRGDVMLREGRAVETEDGE